MWESEYGRKDENKKFGKSKKKSTKRKAWAANASKKSLVLEGLLVRCIK